MEYKVRKGIENPCKIHGLLVRDFYLLLGYGGFAVAVLLLHPQAGRGGRGPAAPVHGRLRHQHLL